METGCSCRARSRIAAAAHNIRVLIGQIACQSKELFGKINRLGVIEEVK